ncbi:MAG: PQQ-binding-like beta-propeller repeat protein, partial [Akkermansiaceae bacterium]|nr:PQQ-binding-like beta-propeller repeat protein [Akkermansiaceae bacterium]
QAGVEQLVTWHPEGVSGLDPASGKVYWTVPLKPTGGAAVSMPRRLGSHLFASGYNKIGAMIALSEDRPGARFEWRSGPKDGVYCVNSTPYLLGDTIYAVDIDQSALMGVSMKDGKRLWETRAPTLAREIAERPRVPRHGTAFIVYHPANKQFWLFGEMGDLIIAELSPEGYREVSRAHLLEPTNTTGSRPVLWSHPAFAMKSAFIRNDRELIRVNLGE